MLLMRGDYVVKVACRALLLNKGYSVYWIYGPLLLKERKACKAEVERKAEGAAQGQQEQQSKLNRAKSDCAIH